MLRFQRGYLLLRLIGDFSNSFRAAVDGQTDRSTEGGLAGQKLNGGARIRYIFNEVFDKNLDKINPMDGLTDRDIQAAIRNAAGPKPAIFLPEAAFELLVYFFFLKKKNILILISRAFTGEASDSKASRARFGMH